MLLEGQLVRLERELKQRWLKRRVKNALQSLRNVTTHRRRDPGQGSRQKVLTIYRSAGLINQAVAFNDAVGLLGLPPGHVDRGGCQLAEVDEAGSAGGCWRRGRRGRKGLLCAKLPIFMKAFVNSQRDC